MRQIERVVAAALAGVVVSSAAAQDAVQWRVEDGGNGHWYIKSSEESCWVEARNRADDSGGALASISSAEEYDFVADYVGLVGRYWLGGYRDAGSDPIHGWRWLSGERFFAESLAWAPKNPGCCEPMEYFLGIMQNGVHDWNACWNSPGLLVEWSADCNEDGIVDYGQILDGTYPDEDGNGVPDCCDADEQCDPCIGDLNGDGVVGPPDLGILLAVWGTDGGDIVGADINGDGTVNASDLGPLLGAWGVCP